MTMHAAYSPGGHRCGAVAIRLAFAVAAAGCAVALCACGSSGGGQTAAGATTATGNDSPLGLSHCMRAHGISNFPDPSSGAGGPGLSISATPGSPTLTVEGVTFSGPAFQRAEQACKRYLPSGKPPKPSASQLAALVGFARCMRAHGVLDFTDPTGNPGGVVAPKSTIRGSGSPAFRRAVNRCGGPPGLRRR